MYMRHVPQPVRAAHADGEEEGAAQRLGAMSTAGARRGDPYINGDLRKETA